MYERLLTPSCKPTSRVMPLGKGQTAAFVGLKVSGQLEQITLLGKREHLGHVGGDDQYLNLKVLMRINCPKIAFHRIRIICSEYIRSHPSEAALLHFGPTGQRIGNDILGYLPNAARGAIQKAEVSSTEDSQNGVPETCA